MPARVRPTVDIQGARRWGMRVLQRVVCAFSLAVCCLLTIVGVVALPLAALLVWGLLGHVRRVGRLVNVAEPI
jgi:hypothetical protein